MADKSIAQYSLITDLQPDDKVLVQRGSQYFSIEAAPFLFNIRKVEFTLTALMLGNLFTTPQVVIQAPGAGKYIQPLGYSFAVRKAGTAFATSTDLRGRFTGDADGDNFLGWSALLAESTQQYMISDHELLDNQFVKANTSFELYAPTTDPTGGTGTVDVTIFYMINEV